ncbi:hypothetical protein PBRA_002996 [Plasmodiophora brassicae]|uniref:Uncharacterized protein n=1 Tax=Plasmodiophora brassicae TaxID=37360 RepID=A0A0G4J6Q1_PLABS|nr:hypothetical protein PBRA_002996 [Plasmodiophora brassicae]
MTQQPTNDILTMIVLAMKNGVSAWRTFGFSQCTIVVGHILLRSAICRSQCIVKQTFAPRTTICCSDAILQTRMTLGGLPVSCGTGVKSRRALNTIRHAVGHALPPDATEDERQRELLEAPLQVGRRQDATKTRFAGRQAWTSSADTEDIILSAIEDSTDAATRN